jgi:D-glycero-beta-D-manno-heptose 1-phosphate adenylyltransferase
MDTREKILSREGLHAVLEEHRRADRKIVFANGVFDLLHAGHGRPVMTERARATVVAALAAVDYVIIFDELDVNPLLREFQPDVHAKGTDYSVDTVPERELAILLGIRTAICGDPKDHSTRDVIARIHRERDA